MPWAISGTYLESCNCEAICPCRRVGGVQGGRSTYGVCMGALSWSIQHGQADGVDLEGLAAVLALSYSDDEEGSPWTFVLYVDERGDVEQRDLLAGILTGQLGGTPLRQFPWVFKPSDLREIRPARIEIDHTPGRGWFRVGDEVLVRVSAPVDEQAPVTCVIPGHDRAGRELHAELLHVDAGEPLRFEFSGRCAYESTFEYSSTDA
jgi:hypothetical protein